MRVRVEAHGLSDLGRTRRHNEDCFGITPDRRLLIVADGMGGHRAGDVASRMVVDAIAEELGDGHSSRDAPPSPAGQAKLLRSAIGCANRKLREAIHDDGSLSGMGTTLVGLTLHGSRGVLAHVGDSRAYRLRDDRFELLTHDHTWVNEQIIAGFLSEEEARVHPLRNVVTRALNGDGEVDPDLREVDLEEGDLFLLCSDGLTAMLRDEEIGEVLATGKPLPSLCEDLVSAANRRGGVDNITVVLASLG